MAAGLGLQAVAIVWLASVMRVDVAYATLVPAFVLGGTGMALVFSPVANAVLSAVRPPAAGQTWDFRAPTPPFGAPTGFNCRGRDPFRHPLAGPKPWSGW